MTEPLSEGQAPPAPPARTWPADYYSSPGPDPAFPRIVTFGCGGAALLALAFIFAGGAVMERGGFTQFMDFALGMSVAEMRGMYGADVPPQRQTSLDAEVEKLRENVRKERIAVTSIQPFLDELRQTTSDKRVNAEEAARLEQTARKINSRAKR
jgi:hypothetical protein